RDLDGVRRTRIRGGGAGQLALTNRGHAQAAFEEVRRAREDLERVRLEVGVELAGEVGVERPQLEVLGQSRLEAVEGGGVEAARTEAGPGRIEGGAPGDLEDARAPRGVVAVDELARAGGRGDEDACARRRGIAAEDLVAADAQPRGRTLVGRASDTT